MSTMVAGSIRYTGEVGSDPLETGRGADDNMEVDRSKVH